MTIILISSVIAILVYGLFSTVLVSGIVRLKPGTTKKRYKVSVIVAAHNEARNIESCLQSLLEQSYPSEQTEIVVVNDRSTDETAALINQICKENPFITSLDIDDVPEDYSPKKFALMNGIEMASGEIIMTTDADCRAPQGWIDTMVRHFEPKTGIVAGPAPFENGSPLLRKYQNSDHLAALLVAAGAAGWNIGITCTGRSLAYRKQVFKQTGGFNSFKGSLSGDDDLFIQTVSKTTDWQIRHVLHPDASVFSDAASNLKQYFRQRRRHISAGKFYSPWLKSAYLVYNLANITLIVFFLASIIWPERLIYAIMLLSIKFMCDFIALSLPARKLKRRFTLSDLIIWETGFFLSQLFIGPTAFIGRLTWK